MEDEQHAHPESFDKLMEEEERPLNSEDECTECQGRGWNWETNSSSGEMDKIPCEWCRGEDDSFDQLMEEVDDIISKWHEWYGMPDTDTMCAAFDAIEEAMTMLPGFLTRHMFHELWSGRVFS